MSARLGAAPKGYSDLLTRALDGDTSTVLLSDAHGRLTRAQIAERVESLGASLREAGCGAETLVALRFDPGIESIVSILAVLSTGAAYLPLDPRHGDQRLEQILTTTTPDFLLSVDGLKPLVDTPTRHESVGLDDLGYVISTSGSTGTPKAAALEQRGLVIHTEAMVEFLGLGETDVVLQTAPPSFDIAVWQCTTPIIAGSRTHVADDEQRLNPKALWRVLIDERVTVTQLVPSMIRIMLESAPPREQLALRHVISTGEALDPGLANAWFEVYPDLPLINLYGPAECSDDVSVHVLDGPVETTSPVPIGRAFAGAHLRVVDDAGSEVTAGVTGQLQVCGDIVGRGYRNDPERTKASFGTVVIAGTEMRSYNTGDLAFVDDTGLLRYVGRADFQVKIRGNRVELGEIEHLLASHEGVRACVVTKFADGTDRLVAHVETKAAIDRSELRRRVADALPNYMVPSAIVLHDQLPLNANGKVDRKLLPAPRVEDLAVVVTGGKSAESRIERALARSWSELLGIDEVPIDADFFDLGGTSLLAIISIDELSKELGYEIPTRTLIMGGSIERIAANLEAGERQSEDLDPTATQLVQIQEGAGGPPLFLYPGEAVSALGMVDLARMVEPGRSVYVFEPARPVDGERGPSMQTLAERCRDAIERVAPEGAVHVAGFCMGGDVSWEIAHQREQQGQATASVLLLQTERDGVYPHWPTELGRVHVLAAKAWQRARFEAATVKALGRAQRRSHVRHLVIGKVIAKFTMPLEKRLHLSGMGPKFGIRRSLRLRQHLWALLDRAAYDDWAPQKLACPVTVIRATEQPPLVDPDPLLGWASTGTDEVDAREVTGFHWSFLHRPAVVELAAVLSQEMRRRDEVGSEMSNES